MLLAVSRNPDTFPSNFLSRQVWAVPPALAHQSTSEHVYKVRPGVYGKLSGCSSRGGQPSLHFTQC